MNKIYIQHLKTNYGELLLGSFNDQLCLCDWYYRRMRTNIDKRIRTNLNAEYIEQPCELLDETIRQLGEYFDHQRGQFELPLLIIGTSFQKSAWNSLNNIPYGSTYTYLQMATVIDNKKAVRAVANAIGANAISIIIPCHRVIGSNGELIGYAGGLPAKRKLLTLEKEQITTEL